MKAQFSSTRDGQMVTIPLAEYRDLMADRVELVRRQAAGVGSGTVCFNHRVRFKHDQELVAFLNEHATSATLNWLRAEAVRRFGADRAPPRSTIARYVQDVRRQLGVTGGKSRKARSHPDISR